MYLWRNSITTCLSNPNRTSIMSEGSVVILGGGIIGLSIAYYLSQSEKAQQIYIVDSAPRLLESASGYAGGFLARDWFDQRIAPLGELSFHLHRQLAESFDGQKRWGYAGSHVYSLSLDDAPAGVRGEDWLLAGTSRAQAAGRNAQGHVNAPGDKLNKDGTPEWIAPQDNASWDVIASAEDCALLNPRKFCEFLLSECKSRGVRILLNTRATEIVPSADGQNLSALKLESTTGSSKPTRLQCSDIVIAAGCWAPRVFNTLFPDSRIKLEIDPLSGHSLLYRTPRYTEPFKNIAHGQQGKYHEKDEFISHSIYCPPTKHWSYSPEAYARLTADGKPEIWIGGFNNNSTELPLPELATDAKALINKESIAHLRGVATHMTGLKEEGKAAVDDLEIIHEALCFRPASKSGVPILDRISERDLGANIRSGSKVWVAGGHGPWGITLSLGTGAVMSDIISGREPRVDISNLKAEASPAPTSKL